MTRIFEKVRDTKNTVRVARDAALVAALREENARLTAERNHYATRVEELAESRAEIVAQRNAYATENARLTADIAAKHDAYAALDDCHVRLRAHLAALVAREQAREAVVEAAEAHRYGESEETWDALVVTINSLRKVKP